MEDIDVSIYCLAFNHERYIRKTLEGFINQKTTFRYEVIVHDDASTDDTANIIKEYEKKYPKIIKPIFQKENQHSKKIKIVPTFILPMVHGKYIAICEGDDVWIDENKLQKQYEAMERNPQCSCCTHYVDWYDVLKKRHVALMPDEKYHLPEGRLDKDTQFLITSSGMFHLNSAFLKADLWEKYFKNQPKYARIIPTGDISLFLYFYVFGEMYFIPRVMSRYNKGTVGSWTERVQRNREKLLEHKKRVIEGLKEYISFLEKYGRADEKFLVENWIERIEFDLTVLQFDFKTATSKKNKTFFKDLPFKLKIKLYIGRLFPTIIQWYETKKKK